MQVGDHGRSTTRTDAAGGVRIDVEAGANAATAPGTSVLATGRGPSGTNRVLIGAVPPRPSGRSPTDTVLPGALAIGMLLFGSRLVGSVVGRRRAQLGSKR